MNLKKENRRSFIKTATIGSIGTLGLTSIAQIAESAASGKSANGNLSINGYISGSILSPLSTVKVSSTVGGTFVIRDAQSRIYAKSNSSLKAFEFKIGGALGFHSISLEDTSGKTLDLIGFKVDTKTEIKDKSGKFDELLRIVQWSLVGEWGETSSFRYNNRIYTVFVGWIRDHTHTLKMMKYFHPAVKDGFDLYANSQREDGMIWDNIYKRTPEPNWWESVLGKDHGDFIRVIENGNYEFKRQPVEADVEYLFVECLYVSWKACGDNEWMSKGIDSAIKAMRYCMKDRYRWSEKYKLIKRGFTIDTWDFVHEYDARQTGYGSAQCIDPDKNDFGVMHGDNTGFIAGCKYISEMLATLGRKEESNEWLKIGMDFKERLDKLAWNGKFYTHYVPEKDDFWSKRDIGKTDPSKQVSLSNAYALNRGVTHEQAVAIIKTYLDIKKNLPVGSPGEWYTIYPIFENGYGSDNGNYEYMNGGVITIVAGELAHGAFEHGFESYGADILGRVLEIGKKHNGYLDCTFKGAKIDVPKAIFNPISLKEAANADIVNKGAPGVPGWSGEGDINDMKNMPLGSQTFRDIPFEIVDPATNGRKSVLIISNDKGYTSKGVVKVGKKAKTIYLLHSRSRNSMVGYATIKYSDGTSYNDYMLDGKIDNWWYPTDRPNWKVAFSVPNGKSLRVGMGIYGLRNPNPEKEIASLEFELLKDNKEKWFIGGITLSDQDPYFAAGDVSFGIPDRWGAAAVGYGLIEGLAGVKDLDVTFSKSLLAPRWEAANEKEANATIKYEASGGYLSYIYKNTGTAIEIEYTGSGADTNLEILLPTGKKADSFMMNGKPVQFITKRVEQSDYAVYSSVGMVGVNKVQVNYK
ncbi:MAG: hypothetical protein SFY32_09005 [Bacteroidota bacterium]|nr:hypothetical protein [Bacteroidota bacterium]